MPRRTTGRYERTTVGGGEEVAAFIPHALPPADPPSSSTEPSPSVSVQRSKPSLASTSPVRWSRRSTGSSTRSSGKKPCCARARGDVRRRAEALRDASAPPRRHRRVRHEARRDDQAHRRAGDRAARWPRTCSRRRPAGSATAPSSTGATSIDSASARSSTARAPSVARGGRGRRRGLCSALPEPGLPGYRSVGTAT